MIQIDRGSNNNSQLPTSVMGILVLLAIVGFCYLCAPNKSDEKSTSLSEYEELQEDYKELQDKYEKLESECEEYKDKYKELEHEHNALLDEYEYETGTIWEW